MSAVENFINHQIALVEKEKEIEVAEVTQLLSAFAPIQLQRRGVALIGLRVTGMRTGLGGKMLVDLELANPGTDAGIFPPHKIRNGDIVGLDEHSPAKQSGVKREIEKGNSSSILSGVVYRVTDSQITIALSKEEEIPAEIQEKCKM